MPHRQTQTTIIGLYAQVRHWNGWTVMSIVNVVLSRKQWCKIEMLLLRTTNRKWYVTCQMPPFSMTLSDPQSCSPIMSLFKCIFCSFATDIAHCMVPLQYLSQFFWASCWIWQIAELQNLCSMYLVKSWSMVCTGYVLSAMAKYRITSADVGYRGTQLKMTLVLEGQQQVIFKPQWYDKFSAVMVFTCTALAMRG